MLLLLYEAGTAAGTLVRSINDRQALWASILWKHVQQAWHVNIGSVKHLRCKGLLQGHGATLRLDEL